MERRIDGADRDRLAVHALEDAVEVLALQRQQLGQRLSTVGFSCRENHALHDRNAPFAEEHVLGAAQPDALGAEGVGEFGLIRLIRVRAYPEAAELVGPGQQLLEPAIETRLAGVEPAVDDLEDLARLRRDLRDLHFTAEAVERDVVAFLHGLAGDTESLSRLVDLQSAGADYRRFAHLAADDGGVRGHAAGGGEDALCDEHAVNVVGDGFSADEHDLLALLRPLDGVIRGEDHLSARGAWRGRQAGRRGRYLLPLVGIEPGREQLTERSGSTSRTASFGVISFSAHEIGRDDDRGNSRCRLPLRVWSMNSFSSWMVNSKSWTSL